MHGLFIVCCGDGEGGRSLQNIREWDRENSVCVGGGGRGRGGGVGGGGGGGEGGEGDT